MFSLHLLFRTSVIQSVDEWTLRGAARQIVLPSERARPAAPSISCLCAEFSSQLLLTIKTKEWYQSIKNLCKKAKYNCNMFYEMIPLRVKQIWISHSKLTVIYANGWLFPYHNRIPVLYLEILTAVAVRLQLRESQNCSVMAKDCGLPAAFYLNVGSERKSIQCTGLRQGDPQRKRRGTQW